MNFLMEKDSSWPVQIKQKTWIHQNKRKEAENYKF